MNQDHLERYENGRPKVRGKLTYGVKVDYWEWFREDGSKMRSGHYDAGKPVGEWTVYDRHGRPYEVTNLDKKPKG